MEPVLEPMPPRPGLRRFGWASAHLDLDPALLMQWAAHEDRDVRRAVMRAPHLGPDSAALLVATRRSGMHTLGMNPAAPAELLGSNPGARRRRRHLLQLVPGGLDELAEAPGGPDQIAAGSPTVDLVLARHPALAAGAARELFTRCRPPVDPWVGALLLARFGVPVGATIAHWSAERRRCAGLLVRAAEEVASRYGSTTI